MALKVLMLKKKESKQNELNELRNSNDFEAREKELEAAVNELNESSQMKKKKLLKGK